MWFKTGAMLLVLNCLGVNTKGGVSQNSTESTTEKILKKPVSVKLLYGETNGIFWTDLESQDRFDPILRQKDITVLGLDYHYPRRTLYFSSWGNIWSVQLDDGMKKKGEPKVVIEDAPGVTSIAVDWVNDRIYWVSPQQSCLWRADLKRSNKTVISNYTEPMYASTNIVLDPYQGLLFLALDGSGFTRFNLDGGDQWQAEVKSDEFMTGVTLAIDIIQARLYISASQDYLPRLVSCGYDGEDLIEYDLTDKWWNDFKSIGVFRDQVFWAVHQEVDRYSVYKANMSSDGSITYELEYRTDVEDLDARIWTLKVFHPELQTPRKIEEMVYEYKSKGFKNHFTYITLYLISLGLVIISHNIS